MTIHKQRTWCVLFVCLFVCEAIMFYWDEALQTTVYGDTRLCFSDGGQQKSSKDPPKKNPPKKTESVASSKIKAISTVNSATQPKAPIFLEERDDRKIFEIKQPHFTGDLHPFYMSTGRSNELNYADTLFPNRDGESINRPYEGKWISKCSPEGTWLNEYLTGFANGKNITIETNDSKNIDKLVLQGLYTAAERKDFKKAVISSSTNLGVIETIEYEFDGTYERILFTLDKTHPFSKAFTDVLGQRDGKYSVLIQAKNGFDRDKRPVTLFTSAYVDGENDKSTAAICLGIPTEEIGILSKFCHWRDVQLSACTALDTSPWNTVNDLKSLRDYVLTTDYDPENDVKYVTRTEALKQVSWDVADATSKQGSASAAASKAKPPKKKKAALKKTSQNPRIKSAEEIDSDDSKYGSNDNSLVGPP